jgi:hypothetical protein
LLTQQVRPPIPTDADIEALQLNVGTFEAMGPAAYFQPPDVMGLRTRASAVISEMIREGEPAQPVQPNTSPVPTLGNSAALTQPDSENILNTLTMPEHRQQYNPGPAATMFGHVPMFQAQMRECASFFAYAQVCLTLCVNQMLCGFMYFMLTQAHQLWKSVDLEIQFSSEEFIFCTIMFSCVWIFMVIAVAVTRLDLAGPKVIMQPLQTLCVLKPLPMVLAVFLDPFQSTHGVQCIRSLLVASTCIFHVFWLRFMETSATPEDLGNGLQLPMQFRAVKNFHVSGVTAPFKQPLLTVGSIDFHNLQSSNHSFQMAAINEASEIGAQRAERQQAANLFAKVHAYQRAIDGLLKGGAADRLSCEDMMTLEALQEQLKGISIEGGQQHMSFESMPSYKSSFRSNGFSVTGAEWIRGEYSSDTGQPLPYWVHMETMELVWELPDPDTKYIDICKLEQAVQALEEWQRTPVDEEPGRFCSEMHALPTLLTSQRQQIPVCQKPDLFCSATPVLTEQQVVHESAEARSQTSEPVQEPRRVLKGPSLSEESQETSRGNISGT